MIPFLDDAAVLQDIDTVGQLDGGKTVTDDQGGASPGQIAKALEELVFRRRIQ